MSTGSDLCLVEEAGVIVVGGELDATSAPALEAMLERIDAPVVIDLQAVTFMDSWALGVLFRHQQRVLPSGGGITILRPSPQALRLLEMVGFR